MADEANSQQQKCLPFYLHKLRTELKLNQIKDVAYHMSAQLCFIHYLDGDLHLIQLDRRVKNEQEIKLALNNVGSFATYGSEVGDAGAPEIFVCSINSDLQLNIHKCTPDSVDLVSQHGLITLLTGTPHEAGIQSAHVVSFRAGSIVVNINSVCLLHFSYKDGNCVSTATINIPEQQHSFETYQILNDVCVCLSLGDESKLIFYNLIHGKKLYDLDIQRLSLDPSQVQRWKLSPDLDTLVVSHQSGEVQCINLDSVFSKPQIRTIRVLASQRTKSADGYLNTCQFGDRYWRRRLVTMHSHEHQTDLKSNKGQANQTDVQSHSKSHANSRVIKQQTGGRVSMFPRKNPSVNSVATSAVPVIEAPAGLHGYCVDQIGVDTDGLLFVYTYNDVSVLCKWDRKCKDWTKHSFKHGEKVLLSETFSQPHLIVTTTHILGLVLEPSVGQEELVSQLMMYSGAALADSVCHLNKWGRCSIPIHTLEVGLQHRQLDNVSFFLKSKENLFSTARAIPSSPDSDQEGVLWDVPYNHQDNMLQLEPTISLLLQTVTSSMCDKYAMIFGRQVLDVTLDFLYTLLLGGLTMAEKVSEPKEKLDLQNALDQLLLYIEDSRVCVRQFEERAVSVSRTGSVSAGSLPTDRVSELSVDTSSIVDDMVNLSESLTREWDHMDLEVFIEDGIMKSRVPELQQYLLQRGELPKADYSRLKSVGVTLAITYIKFGNMVKAKDLLSKLGLNPATKLWEIALYTLDNTLCDSILQELVSMATLSEEQISMVMFLRRLNELYPCRNFDDLRGKHHHVKDSKNHAVLRLANLINPSPVIDLTEECGNLMDPSSLGNQPQEAVETTPCESGATTPSETGETTPCEAGATTPSETGVTTPREAGVTTPSEAGATTPYSEVMLGWVEKWDAESRDMIQLELLLHKPGSDLSLFRKDVIWQYLLSYHMVEVIVAWIHNSFHGNKTSVSSGDAAGWPVSQLGTIPSDFVNHVDNCTSYCRQIVLRAFASHGIFRSETTADFPALLQQLNVVGGVLQTPHPMGRGHRQSVEQCHAHVIQYCIQKDLSHFLWNYCTLHRLSPEVLHAVTDEGEAESSWLPLFTQFYTITRETQHWHAVMHQGSLTNAVMMWGKDSSCIGEMLQSGHTLAALATLMYSPHPLQQVTFVTQQMEVFDGMSSEMVEQAIHMFPKLRVTLFPASVTESSHTDVSVYQLMKGNSPFDPSRLFGWQNTNTCIGEDALNEIPYFSNSQLVSQYAYSEQLRYTYYLKQGRPTFAFLTFLAEEFKHGGPTISSKRLLVAMGTSLWIGVKHFTQVGVPSSCVMFQELLGDDSLLLRTYIQVGNEILTHRNNAISGSMDKRRECMKKNEEETVEMLLKCVQSGRQHAPVVLQALEAAILSSIARDRLTLGSFESGQRWSMAVLFCYQLRLPYTTVFLESCAQTNQWLPFIWFSQLYQYPKEDLLGLLHQFRSQHLQEHLRYVITNADIKSASEEQKKEQAKLRSDLTAKDVRSRMYNKIGLGKGVESDVSSSTSDEESTPSLQEPIREEDSDLMISFDSSPGDVFGVVFAAQATKCPWKSLLAYSITLRNGLFAELAACLQGAVVLPCLCGWLVAMIDSTEHAQFLEHHGKSPWKYTLQTLDAILDICVRRKWGSLLVTGFDIFQQNSPLLPFLQFYAEFTERKNYQTCRLLLDEFKEAVFQFQYERREQLRCHVGDASWVEQTTYRMIQYMLTHTPSMYEVTQLLLILDSESITLVFKHEDPDFRKQCQLLQTLEEGGVWEVELSALMSTGSQQYDVECHRIIKLLIDKCQYDDARKFAKVAGIEADHVTITQMRKQKETVSSTKIWASDNARLKFYTDCSDSFVKQSVSAAKIAEFFTEEAKEATSARERARLYELCLQCVTHTSNSDNQQILEDLYIKVWLNRIQERIHVMESDFVESGAEDMFSDSKRTSLQNADSAKRDLLCVGKMPHTDDTPDNLTEKEVRALQGLIGDLLKQGQVSESCRLASVFHVYSKDLAIILTCIRLSLGAITLENLTPDMLHLLRNQPGNIHRMSIAAPVALLRNSSTISLMSNIQPMIDSVSEENEERIFAQERLLNHCTVGKQTCRRVLTAFKIASVLCIGYDDLVMEDDYQILRSLLKTNCSARFRLAADFLGTSSLSPDEVAGFLSDAILQSYKVSLGDNTGSQEMFFDPGENFSDFHQIVRLCQEPSLLGYRLLDAVAAMSDSLEQTTDIVLTLQTEVLILAHECYTAACDMEGIANILRAARILTSYLEAAHEFQLMTRLLTGVGRYNEMTYIFDALQQNHQFEMLLGKGMEKETKLKTAILDYLKRYHPADNESYTMVALKFMMYREIAQQLRQNADKLLGKLKGRPLENTSDMQTTLQKVAQFFSEAAESYIKDNCIRHAQTCIRMARLVALQIKHLPSNKQVIHLTAKGANLIIAEHTVFTEAYIISEGYQQRSSWAAALCNNVIIRGDMKYLQDFRSHMRITPQLIQDAVERYEQCAEKPAQALNNVRKLLQLCKDVKVQHSVACRLGLKDVLTSLDKGDSASYIQDFSALQR